jgi:hypothetical protein
VVEYLIAYDYPGDKFSAEIGIVETMVNVKLA